MTRLTIATNIAANILANPDRIDLLEAELLKLRPITRVEAGCIRYDLYCDTAEPAHFTVYETWGSRELWQTHMSAPALPPGCRRPMARLRSPSAK